MKSWKRVGVIALALLMVIMLLPIGSFKAHAEGGEDELEALGATYKVGDIIKFGHYEQDGNTTNGKEEIEWEVLAIEGNKALVISKYVLDCQQYHTTWTDITWENCSIRKWLNSTFYNTAFTSSEQNLIPTVSLPNAEPWYDLSEGEYTQDKVFLLSVGELRKYYQFNTWDDDNHFGYCQKLVTEATSYAQSRGVVCYETSKDDYDDNLVKQGYTEDIIGKNGSIWWTRSVLEGQWACEIGWAGEGGAYCECIDYTGGVRPAMYISTKILPSSINLNKVSATMYYGETMTLTANLTPSNVTEKTITWSSSKPAVATVNNGVVKAKSAGKTTITAKTVNGLTAACNITVFADNVSGNIFADIKADSWMYAPAKSVYDKGYMTGTGTLDGRVLFSPNTDMNRTMFVQALYSMDGKPDVTYVQKFSDVKENAWYAKAVTWASNNGVVAGNPDGTFGINGKATREQLALMFYKYAVSKNLDVTVKPSTTLDGFTDAKKVDSWALTAVKWAVERGIISGKGNASAGYRIAPTEKATRVECAAMMNKFSEIYANAPKMGDEDLEEPLALPEEDIEDIPVPADETEDVIIDEEEDSEDEEVPSEDEKGEDEEADSEEQTTIEPEE